MVIILTMFFLDPPYAKQRIANVMAELVELNLLAEDAIIVAETDKDTEIGVGNSYCLIKEKKYGQTMIRIFRYEGVTES